MQKRVILNLFLLVLLLTGCTGDPLDVDVSAVNVDLNFQRLDQDIFGSDEVGLEDVHARWMTAHPELYTIYYQDIVGIGSPNDESSVRNLIRFTRDETMQKVYEAVNEQYADVSDIELGFTNAFKHYKYHFPTRTVPEIAFCQGGFYTRAFETDSAIAVCLDMYLGPNHEIVQQLAVDAFPKFLKKTMRRDYIVVDAMREWLASEFYTPEAFGNSFASEIIYFGKVQYLLDVTMRGVADSTKMKYSSSETKWCIDNEYNIWKAIVDDEVLHSKDEGEISKWIGEGPFTAALPVESPSRVGVWLGWQIVRAYVEDHPEVTIEQLMQEGNVQRILKSYKPNK
jgi:hypothetical protein